MRTEVLGVADDGEEVVDARLQVHQAGDDADQEASVGPCVFLGQVEGCFTGLGDPPSQRLRQARLEEGEEVMPKKDPFSEARRRGLLPASARRSTAKKAAITPSLHVGRAVAKSQHGPPTKRGSAPAVVNPSTGGVMQRGVTKTSQATRIAPPPAARKSKTPSYTTKSEPKGRSSSGMEVNTSTGSTSTRGQTNSAGQRRSVAKKVTVPPPSPSAKLPVSKAAAAKTPVSKRAAGGRAARGSAHQTPEQNAADPLNWANIAKDLGNAGDTRFRSYRTGDKPNATTRSYMQSTGRTRGSRKQKAK
jgi:hypothetical protein